MWNTTTEREEGSIGGDKQERLEEGICGTRLLKERKAPLEVTSKRDTQKAYMWNMTTEREEGSTGGDKQERLEEGICGT